MTNTSLPDLTTLSLNDIGFLIQRHFKPMRYCARPYADAMLDIDSRGMYYQDHWTSIVAYFLSNASTWKGDEARAIKDELKRRLKKRLMNGNPRVAPPPPHQQMTIEEGIAMEGVK